MENLTTLDLQFLNKILCKFIVSTSYLTLPSGTGLSLLASSDAQQCNVGLNAVVSSTSTVLKCSWQDTGPNTIAPNHSAEPPTSDWSVY